MNIQHYFVAVNCDFIFALAHMRMHHDIKLAEQIEGIDFGKIEVSELGTCDELEQAISLKNFKGVKSEVQESFIH